MVAHIGFCESCYSSHVGRAYIVIHCKAHGGGAYVIPIDDDAEYIDDAKTDEAPARAPLEARAR